MASRVSKLKLRRLGIDTYREAVVFMRVNCHVCRSEGFAALTRVVVTHKGKSLIATINMVSSDLLDTHEASLSNDAWTRLQAEEGGEVEISHLDFVSSLSHVRSKIYGNTLAPAQLESIVQDVVAGRYSDIEIASFLTACAGNRMNSEEISALTQAMVHTGQKISWNKPLVVDKHCVGGLPGNRTTPIVVAIAAAHGLTIPKTSSRAITSPAGTADTMEVLAPVELDVRAMRCVVEKEGGCIVWGGAVSLSPADDILISVEKALDLDSEGQMVASIISKKIASGSTHVLIDMPVGPTAKVRSLQTAEMLSRYLAEAGMALGLAVKTHISDGTQPVGYGIGPALEARDVVAVLCNDKDAPTDLRGKALDLAGDLLEFSPDVKVGTGRTLAFQLLQSGAAWKKFQAICKAQGGLREIPKAMHTQAIFASTGGIVRSIDNRRISRVAKLAGAPLDKTAGVDMKVQVGGRVEKDQPLYVVHASALGELDYALTYAAENEDIIRIEAST
jgi:thymidine phosphorylase